MISRIIKVKVRVEKREKRASYTVNQMRGAGTEKEQMHLTQAFDNLEIMVFETFSALNTRVY